ncbi:MAG: hypothetical protein A3B99_01050 [Candidatus Yanofskybacteria bacterium RIFCSPHIGHO2_02_FULL_44_12b]|nr:MAG: hypothetical protein A2659_02155 [Candidatus Yanofskybacteria bacterium RIFCSPHIGHO2_01_FULL_44_24]OGN15816.1 MAG: hypothetical protein A3B99_01050 [Candidatus Yanofskybacteria bacterium RIFCSPHIGHO2_02_FULL_44_12b]OGN26143.1 MAG: hypothetical protein A2925_05075 [Candidatus Yanofskybacteria bacterium RIFCSPLOWO2_01_FULL_44_22]
MIKYYLSVVFLSVLLVPVVILYAQESPVLTASLNTNTPPAKILPASAVYADVALIDLAASGGDIYLSGIYLATDVPIGLSNFSNIYIYDDTTNALVATYPSQSENSNLVEFNFITIANGFSKTYRVKASLSASAAGSVRLGFSGFKYSPTIATQSGVPVYGNIMTLPGIVPTPTPTSTPTPTPSATPLTKSTPALLGFTTLAAVGLSEGDTVSAVNSTDPDIYIVNSWGYKRLFLNPVIFGFYGHLGGFTKVKTIVSSTRDVLVTSGLFRNCETDDPKVYGVEVMGEDSGILHWIDTSGDQAVADDPDFFKKVFCVNSDEFNWYSKGSDYTSVNQVPSYSR